ncbi:hypothetical protein HGB25_01915 [Candidatus Saccharibacteria bacterium]|nr:hypothetical protein [Candidatus Saccharibacteria bacterium]
MSERTEQLAKALIRGLDYCHQNEDCKEAVTQQTDNIHDLITLPTVISLAGLAIVISGSRKIDTLEGVNQVAFGRGFDLLDGFCARALDQETSTGAFVDAACDKVGMGFMVANAWKKDVVPKIALSAIIASNATNASLSTVAKFRHPEIHYRTPIAGKHAMSLYNAGLIGYAYASAFENEHPEYEIHEPIRILSAGAIITGSALAIPAASEYLSRALK